MKRSIFEDLFGRQTFFPLLIGCFVLSLQTISFLLQHLLQVSTILTGLLSFMNESAPTLGSVTSTETEKKNFAKKSGEFNLRVC